MSTIEFDGRVAIVTGAGGGLGRSHALLLAERGARVVVNDLGGDPAGREDGSSSPADKVVAEIEEAGGTAIANYDNVVTGADALVQTALDAFGGVDIVINNAGILRDVSFRKQTPEDFDAVVQVHLYGTVNVTRAAWPHLLESGSGRVINTTSGAGLWGNFGQSNYAAAKLGIVGFTRTLAVEGASKGVTANVIAPLAASRLTKDVFPEELFERLQPEYVSALVAYLASTACTETSRVFEMGGGYYARVALVESSGVVFDGVPAPEDLASRWDELMDVSNHIEPAGAMDIAMQLLSNLASD